MNPNTMSLIDCWLKVNDDLRISILSFDLIGVILVNFMDVIQQGFFDVSLKIWTKRISLVSIRHELGVCSYTFDLFYFSGHRTSVWGALCYIAPSDISLGEFLLSNRVKLNTRILEECILFSQIGAAYWMAEYRY